MSKISEYPIGKVAIIPKGNYNEFIQYELYDLVTYGGSSYLAKQSVKGILPGNTTYWQLIAISGSGGPALDSNGILYWPTALIITKQPQYTAVKDGEQATITVEAIGDGILTYQWYFKFPNEAEFRKSGVTTNKYILDMDASLDGLQVYCQVSDEENSIDSEIATIRLIIELTITDQPQDVSAKAGEQAKVMIEAIGDGILTYQWYFKFPNEAEFRKSSVTTNKYILDMGASLDGLQVYCQIKDRLKSINSNIATIRLKQ